MGLAWANGVEDIIFAKDEVVDMMTGGMQAAGVSAGKVGVEEVTGKSGAKVGVEKGG